MCTGHTTDKTKEKSSYSVVQKKESFKVHSLENGVVLIFKFPFSTDIRPEENHQKKKNVHTNI